MGARMSYPSQPSAERSITTFDEFVRLADYSLMDTLNADPDATVDGDDRRARQVFSGHFVPVTLKFSQLQQEFQYLS